MRRNLIFVLSFLCFLTLSTSLHAQQVTAAITGKVVDSSGGALVGAKVVAQDKDRGTEWPTATNSDGVFNLPRLPIGTYDVKVSAAGLSNSRAVQHSARHEPSRAR